MRFITIAILALTTAQAQTPDSLQVACDFSSTPAPRVERSRPFKAVRYSERALEACRQAGWEECSVTFDSGSVYSEYTVIGVRRIEPSRRDLARHLCRIADACERVATLTDTIGADDQLRMVDRVRRQYRCR